MALVEKAMRDGAPIAIQMLAEFLNVCRRKQVMPAEDARKIVTSFEDSCALLASAADDLRNASNLAQRFQMQYFDALILTVAGRAGATTLFSEDMQDGLTIGPLTVVNPFKSSSEMA